MVYKFLDKRTGLGASVNQDLAQELLLQKPYFPSPGIPWKAQKYQVNIIFP